MALPVGRQLSHKIAQLPLDFAAEWSVCGACKWQGEVTMDAAIAETAIKVYLKEIHTRLEEAASIAKAADACAHAGNADKGVHYNNSCGRTHDLEVADSSGHASHRSLVRSSAAAAASSCKCSCPCASAPWSPGTNGQRLETLFD